MQPSSQRPSILRYTHWHLHIITKRKPARTCTEGIWSNQEQRRTRLWSSHAATAASGFKERLSVRLAQPATPLLTADVAPSPRGKGPRPRRRSSRYSNIVWRRQQHASLSTQDGAWRSPSAWPVASPTANLTMEAASMVAPNATSPGRPAVTTPSGVHARWLPSSPGYTS